MTKFNPTSKKNGLLMLFFACSLFFNKAYAQQDYIVNLEGDTLLCKFVKHPKKVKKRPYKKYLNGRDSSIAILKHNDSIIVVSTSNTIAFNREKNGKGELFLGRFHNMSSKKWEDTGLEKIRNKHTRRSIEAAQASKFLAVLYQNKDITVYFYISSILHMEEQFYFFEKKTANGKVIKYCHTVGDAAKWLSTDENFEVKNPRKKFFMNVYKIYQYNIDVAKEYQAMKDNEDKN